MFGWMLNIFGQKTLKPMFVGLSKDHFVTFCPWIWIGVLKHIFFIKKFGTFQQPSRCACFIVLLLLGSLEMNNSFIFPMKQNDLQDSLDMPSKQWCLHESQLQEFLHETCQGRKGSVAERSADGILGSEDRKSFSLIDHSWMCVCAKSFLPFRPQHLF